MSKNLDEELDGIMQNNGVELVEYDLPERLKQQGVQPSYYPVITSEAKTAIKHLIVQEKIKELKNLPVTDYDGDDDVWFEYISVTSRDDRIAELEKELEQ